MRTATMTTTTIVALVLSVLAAAGEGRKLVHGDRASLAPRALAAEYSNPVIPDIELADPVVVRLNGTFYMYATGDVRPEDIPQRQRASWGAPQAGANVPLGQLLEDSSWANGGPTDCGYRVFISEDLVNWRRGPVVFVPPDHSRYAWAPHVWFDETSGYVYMYYTLHESVGVARATSPLGPFDHVNVLVEKAIDAYLLADEEFGFYLYYVDIPQSQISVHKMLSPVEMDSNATAKVVLHHEDIPWESHIAQINEAPWVFRHNGTLYLMYSGSFFYVEYYAVGYATAKHPEDYFIRDYVNNPIMHHTDKIFGPGHVAMIKDDAGARWVVYHQKMDARIWREGQDRRICIDELHIAPSGELIVNVTRNETRPAPFIQPRAEPSLASFALDSELLSMF